MSDEETIVYMHAWCTKCSTRFERRRNIMITCSIDSDVILGPGKINAAATLVMMLECPVCCELILLHRSSRLDVVGNAN